MSAENKPQVMYLVPENQWNKLTNQLKYIIANISNSTDTPSKEPEEEYITAEMFMNKVIISRSTFDELRDKNQIRVIQKNRKLYLPKSEIHRYFNS